MMNNKNVNVELRVANVTVNDLLDELNRNQELELGYNEYDIVNCRCVKLYEKGMRISLVRTIARMCGVKLHW